jgi:hypothetical protein
MAYIRYNDDPLAKRVSDAFANLCSSVPTKRSVRLIDKCFSIYNGSTKETSFCEFSNLFYPTDGSLSIDFEVCAGETLAVYDNNTDEIASYAPTDVPTNYPFGADGEFIQSVTDGLGGADLYFITSADRNYARGCLLWIKYPVKDKNGNDILPADQECQLTFTNRLLETNSIPLHQMFAHFVNPETRGADSLINKIEVYNPNPNFSIKVSGLVIYTKSNSDPNDCAC